MVQSQVESYANLAEPVLESMRNLTPLAFDILTFLIVDKLASSGRQKLKVSPETLNPEAQPQAKSSVA